MAYPFESRSFRYFQGYDDKNNALKDNKLDNCAKYDSKHIWTGAPPDIRTGTHVWLIQYVLGRLGLNISEDEHKTATYGPTTAAAVLKFKTDRQIKRPCRPIDNIVGSRTIQALDDEAKKQKKQEDDALVDETTFWIDVVSQAWQTAID